MVMLPPPPTPPQLFVVLQLLVCSDKPHMGATPAVNTPLKPFEDANRERTTPTDFMHRKRPSKFSRQQGRAGRYWVAFSHTPARFVFQAAANMSSSRCSASGPISSTSFQFSNSRGLPPAPISLIWQIYQNVAIEMLYDCYC